MRTFKALLLAAILTAAAAFPALPSIIVERSRHALVIGIDAYDNVADLKKARNDAVAVATKLEALGFEVLKGLDVNRAQYISLLSEFTGRVGPWDDVVFYFAGHGFAVDGHNYLLPSDVPNPMDKWDLVLWKAIPVDRIITTLPRHRAGVAMLILDVDRPVSVAHVPENTFILFSAGFNQRPLESLGSPDLDENPNSIFVRSLLPLLPLLEEPGLSLQELARRVQADVYELARSIGHNQIPAHIQIFPSFPEFSNIGGLPEFIER